MSAPRLSPEIKKAILDAYLAGDKIDLIAGRFGVDRSYPRILFRRHSGETKGTFCTPKKDN